MQVSVTFRNMESKEILREYVQEKISKLKKYFDYPLEANVVLIVEKHRHIAEVTLVANRLTINAQEETEDMFSAIDRVLESSPPPCCSATCSLRSISPRPWRRRLPMRTSIAGC